MRMVAEARTCAWLRSFGYAYGCGGSTGGHSEGHIYRGPFLHDEKDFELSKSITSIYRSLFLTSVNSVRPPGPVPSPLGFHFFAIQ